MKIFLTAMFVIFIWCLCFSLMRIASKDIPKPKKREAEIEDEAA